MVTKVKKSEAKAAQSTDQDVGPEQTIIIKNTRGFKQLKELLAPCGKIMFVLFNNLHNTRQAFVVLDSAKSATKALKLNGSQVDGRAIIVEKPKDVLFTPKRPEEKPVTKPILKSKTIPSVNPNAEKTIFVENLKTSVTPDDLTLFFSSCGPIKYVKILKHHKTKESLGKAFVCFSDSNIESALQLDKTLLEGQPINIQKYVVKPKKERPAPKNSEKAKKFGKKIGKVSVTSDNSNNDKATVFVKNLKDTATSLNLKKFFSSCGEVKYVKILKDKKGVSQGKGFVCFKDPASVTSALELHETKFENQPINVELYSKN